MRDDGIIRWTPPVGRWSVLRLQFSFSDAQNAPASPDEPGDSSHNYERIVPLKCKLV
jgi:hypothetical protein